MHTIELHGLALTDNRPIIGERLWRARDSAGFLRLHDGTHYRGYATRWGRTRWQAVAWSIPGADRRQFTRRTYKTQAGAERALIREGLKLAGAL